jgi:L,D-peptidoglycan transpeptidase YkuD (ErfK/YbiS/YcfS/YnhG family)
MYYFKEVKMKKRLVIFSAVVIFIFTVSLSIHRQTLGRQSAANLEQATTQEETNKAEDLKVEKENNRIMEQIRLDQIKRKQEIKRREELNKQEELKSQKQAKKAEEANPLKTVKPVSSPVKQPVSSPQTAAKQTRLIDIIKAAQNSQQVILVQSNTFKTDRVIINTYEKVSGEWKEVLTNISGFIGRAGFSTNRREGDMTSPVGVFRMPYLFGWGGNPGFKMPYKPSTNEDFWLSLPVLADYNVWVHREDGPDPSWTKDQYEVLGPEQKLYKYAAVMDFNMGSDKVVGKGSAIFLHINPASERGTAGCTSMPEAALLQTLKWLDPAKKPVIIQGPVSELNKM